MNYRTCTIPVSNWQSYSLKTLNMIVGAIHSQPTLACFSCSAGRWKSLWNFLSHSVKQRVFCNGMLSSRRIYLLRVETSRIAACSTVVVNYFSPRSSYWHSIVQVLHSDVCVCGPFVCLFVCSFFACRGSAYSGPQR